MAGGGGVASVEENTLENEGTHAEDENRFADRVDQDQD